MLKLATAAAVLVSAAHAADSSKPNLVLIVADDLGYGDLGAFGHPTIATPEIDRMAQEGMKLSQFYSAAPLCTPSRAAMLTGRLPVRQGVYCEGGYPLDNIFRVYMPSSVGALPSNETTIAELLKEDGYSTAAYGKWHLGHNPDTDSLPGAGNHGFDDFMGLPYSHEEGYPGPSVEGIIWPPVPLMQNPNPNPLQQDEDPNREVGVMADLILKQPFTYDLTQTTTDKVLDVIDGAAANGTNFFVHLGYEQPHVPLFASEQFLNTSRRGLYGDAVQEIDDSVGRILQKLRDTGLDENTLVFFTSDNGAWENPGMGIGDIDSDALAGGSNAPFRGGKGSTWEGGLRVPAVAWWPGTVPAGVTSMEMVTMMDLFPTMAELTGQPLPDDRVIDGKSIAGLLKGDGAEVHDAIYHWRESELYALRWGPWKAHWMTRPGFGMDPPEVHDPPLIYNVEWDPAEAVPVNATTVPEVLAKVEELKAAHLASVVPGESNYVKQDFRLVPCCNSGFDVVEAIEFGKEHEWGMALWDECVCQDEI